MLFLVFCLFGLSISLFSQSLGFKIPPDKKKVEIPFLYKNGFIIIDLVFDGRVPMQFIFDTGAEYTILTKKEISDILGLKYVKEYRIMGSDLKTELTAYLTRGVTFHYKDLGAIKQDIFVLQEDYFHFDEFTGINISGIVGANFFRNLAVEVNYKKQVITFHKAEKFQMNKNDGFTEIDIDIHKGKPYLSCDLEIIKGQTIPVKLLIDTGASLGLLLHTDSTGILRTPTNAIPGHVGSGLGGKLMGFLGRVNQLQFDEFHFDSFIAAFQDINDSLDTSNLYSRNGLIGNLILRRFNLIIDYPRNKLYLKPTRKYNKGFNYDRSGLNLIADGEYLNQFIVQNVIRNSPAALAGIKKGDRLLSFNGIRASLLSITRINTILQKKPGKKIRVKVKRGKEKLLIKFKLKDLI